MHISDTAEVHSSANTTISAIALVAQWIERRFPEPQVACSIHAEGTGSCRGHWVMPRALGHAEGTGLSWNFKNCNQVDAGDSSTEKTNNSVCQRNDGSVIKPKLTGPNRLNTRNSIQQPVRENGERVEVANRLDLESSCIGHRNQFLSSEPTKMSR